jgi:hypothetical protein
MCGDWMIYTDKYEGHTPADEWRLVFTEVNDCYNKEMLGLTVRAYHLGQMQACDPEDYLVAQANQDLARDAPLLLAEVKRLRALFEETNHHLDLMVERFGIEALVEMVGEEE